MIQAVVGVLVHERRILVALRPENKPYAGYWELPGGKVEPNESSFAALKRELEEELGIHVLKAHPLFQHTHAYPDKTVSLDLWRVTHFEGEPKGIEKQWLRWVEWDELLALKLLEGNLAILEKLKGLLL